MSIQFHRAITDILSMPYYKNEAAKSGQVVHGHEDAVALVFKNNNFKELDKQNYKKLTKKILKEWAITGDDSKIIKCTSDMEPGSYIKQPAGSQGFPDILVKDYNARLVALECKSVKGGGTPMWNDSLPKFNAIYIMNSGKYNATTLFLGQDVISQEELDLMKELEEENNKRAKEYATKLASIDQFNRGWIQRARKQHFQFGGALKTDYFVHPDRTKCEQNVLQYAKQ
jgi:hypothetical protein